MKVRALAFATLLSGCVASTGSYADRDLSRLDPEEIVLVGSVRLVVNDIDQTENSTIETDRAGRSFQLGRSGDVIWVVERPPRGTPGYLTWIATPFSDGALSLGAGAQLVSSKLDPSVGCSYFGTLTIHVKSGYNDDTAARLVGWSLPEGGVTQALDDAEHRARLVRTFPALFGLRCQHALGSATVELGAQAPASP